MPFEVFSPLMRCAEIHAAHVRLSGAASCYNQIDTVRGGNIPTWTSSGKYVHVIARVDRHGDILDFTAEDETQANALALPPQALLTRRPGITTFSEYAKMYYEASRLIPISSLNLQGMFDYGARGKHYWTTEAGTGQALAFAQQVAFTLELSLKALLEVTGKLLTVSKKDWQVHDLAALHSLLEQADQQFLQQRWQSSSPSERSNYNTLLDFLTAVRNLYMDLRYIPTLKTANLSMDTQAMLNASLIVLRRSESWAWQLSPIKPKVTVSTINQSSGGASVGTVDLQNVMVKGIVRSINIPDDFDPNSLVEVVIDPTCYFNGSKQIPFDGDVTAGFRRCDVESYFGLEGEEVMLGGRVTAAEPSLLMHAQHVGQFNREASYKVETRTVKGQVYNLIPRETSYKDSTKVTLILRDVTFLSDVDCLFITEEERTTVGSVELGAEVTVSGQVALLNGRPVSLVGPTLVD